MLSALSEFSGLLEGITGASVQFRLDGAATANEWLVHVFRESVPKSVGLRVWRVGNPARPVAWEGFGARAGHCPGSCQHPLER